MGKLIEKIIDTENLQWAWKKVKNSFRVGDIWYDEIELYSFEANLHENLENIKNEIRLGTYSLSPITPLPYPKGCDKEGNPRVRQTFDIRVKDQVVWMAVVNVIGSSLDYEMPFWSYGHRLFVPFWKNMEDCWEMGWYTNSNGQLYRKWNQSWPLFRRNISLTAKIMCHEKSFDEAEKNVLQNNESLLEHFRSKYLKDDYWAGKSSEELYWGTIDFSKFYPKVRRNVIEENIIKYEKGAKDDAEFKRLLNKLFDFRIESPNWSSEELSKEKGIDLDPDKFQGLPTGLFVAGFLANVALLDIDKKMSKKLRKNRDVAHFRFVDDHVILSYDFEKLKTWITNYKDCLDEKNTGVEFNFEKIEPLSLANVLDPKNENITNEDQEKAKKDCLLDPKFPAPLMTQTLAKVSAINNSDFEFLTANEEEQLISDLEHLLLTDFPDHELRKDTRVSFAASVLSRIVPNTKEDYSKVYECQKRIFNNLNSYKKKYETTDDNFLISKLHDILFLDSVDPNYYKKYFDKWVKKIQKTKNREDKEKENRISAICDEKINELKVRAEIDQQKKEQKQHVFRLLNKAVSESPEKVRIWPRVIDYCRKVGECHIKEAYDKIKELTDKNIHRLSASFLRSLFMNVLADRIMQAVYDIVNNKLISKKQITNAKHFVNTVFDKKLLDDIKNNKSNETKDYYLKTYDYFSFVLGTVIFILKETQFELKNSNNVIKKYNLIDWDNNPKSWIEKTQNTDINNWLYWLLWKTHDKSLGKPLEFWEKMLPYIDFSSPTCKALILPFPNSNIREKEESFFDIILENEFDEGWLYEVFKPQKENLSEKVKAKLKAKNPNLFNNIFSDKKNLWDFIQWQQQKLLRQDPKKEKDFFNSFFDPRLSEWTALELLSQIMKNNETVDDFFSNKPSNKLHLANFTIPEEFEDESKSVLSWHEWKDIVKKHKIKPIENHQISEERYTTKGLLELGHQKVHALGIMLLQLVTHCTDLPWIWNSPDKSLTSENLFYKKIENIPISSYTMLILQSCFSSKNRELFRHENKTDNSYEIPAINDVNTLKECVNNAKNFIEKYQLSMEDNIPRQLIPISLKVFSSQNNPFESDNENIE